MITNLMNKFSISLVAKNIEIKGDTIFHLPNSTEAFFRIQLMRVSENYRSPTLLIKVQIDIIFLEDTLVLRIKIIRIYERFDPGISYIPVYSSQCYLK